MMAKLLAKSLKNFWQLPWFTTTNNIITLECNVTNLTMIIKQT